MNTLKIAVQKSDRIAKDFISLLQKCDIQMEETKTKLYCKYKELPIEIFFIRGIDIQNLMLKNFDCAVIGEDTFLENKMIDRCEIIKRLDFSKCHISIAGLLDKNFNIQKLQNKRIATTYTNILQDCLQKYNISAEIIKLNGSVETSIDLNIADYIFDIVQTGETLKQQGLTELQKMLNFEAILIKNKTFSNEILDELIYRIDAVLLSKKYQYIMFNLQKKHLDKIKQVLPSGQSPTILNLIDENYVAIHSLCEKNKIFAICKELKNIGANNIIVSDVNLMIK